MDSGFMIYLSRHLDEGLNNTPLSFNLCRIINALANLLARDQPEVRFESWSLESPFKRLPGLPLPRCNEAQGWCAVCRDPRLEDSFQARACIDDLKEVSAAIVKCGTDLTKS